MHRDGITLSEDIVDFIASNVKSSVRDLEGILASLLAHSTLTEKEIDLALAEQVVSHIVAIEPRKITIGDIISTVADHYNMTEKALLSANRSRDITQVRHITAYLCKELTNCSLTEIGFKLGRRTHATMLHSVAIIKNQLEFDPSLRQHIAQLESSLR